jgi:hypothetical protein
LEIDSKILVEFSTKDLLFKICGFDSSQKWTLLYRGSQHGFKASNFHAKCDNIPKTLTIIKTNKRNVFGGYTEATWESPTTETWKCDKSAFLFNLTHKRTPPVMKPVKVNVANGREAYAICCKLDLGPCFGGGDGKFHYDLGIKDYSNLTLFNESDLGSSYILKDCPINAKRAKSFLPGSSTNFTVTEIEVFKRN